MKPKLLQFLKPAMTGVVLSVALTCLAAKPRNILFILADELGKEEAKTSVIAGGANARPIEFPDALAQIIN